MLTDNVLALMNSTLTSLEKRAIHSDVRKYSKKYHLFDIIKLFFMPIYSDLGHFVHEVTVKAKAYLAHCETSWQQQAYESKRKFLVSKSMKIVKRLLILIFLIPSVVKSKIIILEEVMSTHSEKAVPLANIKLIPIPAQTVSASPSQPVWLAKTGSTLRESVLQWADKAGWQVLWMPEDLDYPIIADLRYEGSFERAVTDLFHAYEKAERPFWVNGNSTQKALMVTERHAAQ